MSAVPVEWKRSKNGIASMDQGRVKFLAYQGSPRAHGLSRCTVISPTVLEMAKWSKTSCSASATSSSKIFTRIHVLGGFEFLNEYLTTRLYRRPHFGKKDQVGLSRRARAKRATRTTCVSNFLGVGQSLSYSLNNFENNHVPPWRWLH